MPAVAPEHIPRSEYLDTVAALKEDGYNMLIDITSVDFLTAQDARTLPEGISAERFEIVVNLLSMDKKERKRLRVQVPESEPVVPTLFDLYPGAEAMEREVFDLMGIRFDNHPDLTRILMPEDWEGHPLRKDYDQQRIPVQFKYTANEYDTSRESTEVAE